MKRILIFILVSVLGLSLCACREADRTTMTTHGVIHVERYYQDTGELFYIVEINSETGTVITTYFYWQHDNSGRRTLSGTECITVDRAGNVVDHIYTPAT